MQPSARTILHFILNPKFRDFYLIVSLDTASSALVLDLGV